MISGPDRYKLLQVIVHFQNTKEEDWTTDVVRSSDGTKNCCLGHVFNMGGDNEKLSNQWWNWFEELIASTYMIYPVNDGKHPDYQQETPKARIIAYCRNVLDGKELTVPESMDKEYEEYLKRRNINE